VTTAHIDDVLLINKVRPHQGFILVLTMYPTCGWWCGCVK